MEQKFSCPYGYPSRRSRIYYGEMSAVGPAVEIAQSARVPTLLVELPSRPHVFFGNVRDLFFSRRLAPLELSSTPAEFWPDVFVKGSFPWTRFVQSAVYHGIAGALFIGLTRFFALQPHAVSTPAFDHSQVVYYRTSEYLPPLDTRRESAAEPAKADPEFSRQPIISVPPEADNRSQTIVAPPALKLKQDVALPNIVSWSEAKEPRLAIPDAPLTPAADITRMAPHLESTVVTPPPDAAHLTQRRMSPALQDSIVAPPPELNTTSAKTMQALQPAPIAPPPTVENSQSRRLGDLTIAPSAVIAPAPQLSLAPQHSVLASGLSAVPRDGQAVVPPPPSVSGSGSSGSFGSRGKIIALSLHPSADAPPEPPAGNRRGSFAATPEGHPGASGSTGSNSGAGKEGGSSTGKARSDLPAGLYVGKATKESTPVAGDAIGKGSPSVNPNLIANARPPRVSGTSARTGESAAKLSEAERTVFADRKFYSLTLNMPNLNSAGGSWVIRFAELKPEAANGNGSQSADLSQPTAIRKVDPAYPMQLMRENVAGTVILYGVIHADGSVGNVRVLRGVDERLDRFASDAIAQWRFTPATKNGSPVDVEATFQIPFRPGRAGMSF